MNCQKTQVMIEEIDPQLNFINCGNCGNAPFTLQLKKEFNIYDIVSLGKGRSQLYMATLPRLKSRVRIPSPAPNIFQFLIYARYAVVSSYKYLKFYIFGDGIKLALNAIHLLSS